MTAILKINEELNGIELYFASKPGKNVLETLKANKFRWSGFKGCWYTKQSDKAFQVANSFVNGSETVAASEQVKTVKAAVKNTMSLWDACQWSEIELTQAQKDQDDKLIAKEIRTHIKKRFPMLKFSVRVPYYGKINFDITSKSAMSFLISSVASVCSYCQLIDGQQWKL